MHETLGADDLAAERLRDGLMPETDAEERDLPRELADCAERHACRIGVARPWREQDGVGLQCMDSGYVNLVVPHDLEVCAEGTQPLHQVVRKRIIVVDYKYHGDLPF